MSDLPCDACKAPEHCTGRWPDDDPHRPGQVRGCFAEKSASIGVTTTAGKTMNGRATKANPSWEKGRPGEKRPGGTFMPYLDPKTGAPMTQKRWAEGGRREVEEGKRRLAQTKP